MLSQHPFFVILAAAVLAPLLAELPAGRRLPVVVLEVVLGVIVGPHALGLVQFDKVLEVMFRVGMVAVLFMAGMEIDFQRIRGRPLSLGLLGWLASLALAFAAVALLHVIPSVQAPMMVTLALAGVLLRPAARPEAAHSPPAG